MGSGGEIIKFTPPFSFLKSSLGKQRQLLCNIFPLHFSHHNTSPLSGSSERPIEMGGLFTIPPAQ